MSLHPRRQRSTMSYDIDVWLVHCLWSSEVFPHWSPLVDTRINFMRKIPWRENMRKSVGGFLPLLTEQAIGGWGNAEPLRMLTAFPKGQNSVPSIQIWLLTSA